jgi:tRNA1(Val) A37 N6-methylase TrmN6
MVFFLSNYRKLLSNLYQEACKRALFQKSVLKKHLNDLDQTALNKAWQLFKDHFQNPVIRQNIREAKEEEYQEGFVRDLFVNILGYTLKPQPNYNFVLERKTEADRTKSDGAILGGDSIIAVVELKDASTIELDKIEKQVFSYKSKHRNCPYVITSNFQKVRFYINDAIDFEEFNLFELTPAEFAVLYVCLQQKNIIRGLPLEIKEASLAEEDAVTKKLYKDYSQFKKVLFTNIVTLNPTFDKLELLKKTQKLLDRFLFILFAEDRLLVPPNTVREELAQWETLRELDNYVPLYDRFKKYFGYLNTGHQRKHDEIFAYNGGLFAPDELLDQIQIDDQVLYEGCKQLSHYDFESEIDVNILGHIFEHSLAEIEEVQAKLQGRAFKKRKSRKKKDEGIFYTPRYITKYIVDNTIGELCREKKIELAIEEDQFIPNKRKANKRLLLTKLEQYRQWLLNLRVCDPACGSGAFLNQAVDFLIAEHRTIDELKAKLFGDALVLTDVDNEILEHNIFGVDINEDAVEIARLSLWLRTARRGRRLSNLSNNIKCGNSIIDDSTLSDKAFDWRSQFMEIFDNGGFDVVIGNPPYGARFSPGEKQFFKKEFKASTKGKIDSYRIFMEKGFRLTKRDGFVSYITPNTFLYNIQSKCLRKKILTELKITDAVELRKNIFEDAPDVVPTILTLKNTKCSEYSFRARVAFHNKKYKELNTDNWATDQQISLAFLLGDPELKINLRTNVGFYLTKQKIETYPVLDNFFSLKQGTKPYGEKENKKNQLLSNIQHDATWEKAINGRDIARYSINLPPLYVQRSDQLHSVLPKQIVDGEKIYFQRMRKISLFPRIVSCYDDERTHGLYTCSVIYSKSGDINLKYLLCLLNSFLINIWYKYFDTDVEIKLASVKKIPVPPVRDEIQRQFIDKAELMLSQNKKLQLVKQQLIELLSNKYVNIRVSKKLQNWPSLSAKQFLNQLGKVHVKLSLGEQAEWMNYFAQEKEKANQVQRAIADTDEQIDQMVCHLYGLTPEEIKIVEEERRKSTS